MSETTDMEFKVRGRAIARSVLEMFNLLRRLVIVYKDYEEMCEKWRTECEFMYATLPEDLPFIVFDIEELVKRYTTKDLDVMIEVMKKWIRVKTGGEG
jgi:hypothetical protein